MSEPLITRRELATRLDVHMQTITKWEREDLPIAERGRKGKPSLYNEVEVRAWLKAREDKAKGPDAPLNPLAERANKERWQALLAEQTFLQRQRDLLPRQEIEKAWAAEVAAIRSVILAAPVTHADRIHRAAVLDGVVGVERELKSLMNEVLRQLGDPNRELPNLAPDDDGTEELITDDDVDDEAA